MKTTAILPILVLLSGTAALPLGSAFADSQANSSTTTDPIAQLFAIIQNLLSRITGIEKNVSALQQKTNTLESRISQLEKSHQNTINDEEEKPVVFLSNSTHNDGHDNEHDHENDEHNNGNHFGKGKQDDNKHEQTKQESD